MGEWFSWGVNIVDSFIDLIVPVLVIPERIRYQAIQNIAFAWDYGHRNLQIPILLIRNIMQFTKAKLHIIHVASPEEKIDETFHDKKIPLLHSLKDHSPFYYEPRHGDVITATDHFIVENNIDMLMLIPSTQGIWHHFFQKSHSKEFIYLNHVPVLSLHQEGNFII